MAAADHLRELAGELEHIDEQLADAAMDLLRGALSEGSTSAAARDPTRAPRQPRAIICVESGSAARTGRSPRRRERLVRRRQRRRDPLEGHGLARTAIEGVDELPQPALVAEIELKSDSWKLEVLVI